MSKCAADKVYSKSGLSPSDVQVVELHDCFSANELISYEALGLCPPGEQSLSCVVIVCITLCDVQSLQLSFGGGWVRSVCVCGGGCRGNRGYIPPAWLFTSLLLLLALKFDSITFFLVVCSSSQRIVRFDPILSSRCKTMFFSSAR